MDDKSTSEGLKHSCGGAEVYSAAEQDIAVLQHLPTLVDWDAVKAIVHDIALTLDQGTSSSLGRVRQLTSALCAPLYLLQELLHFGMRAYRGDGYAERQLAQLLNRLASNKAVVAAGQSLLSQEPIGVAVQERRLSRIVNYQAATEFLIAARNAGSSAQEESHTRLAAAIGLLSRASNVERVLRARIVAGREGLVQELRWTAFLQSPQAKMPAMHTLSGQVPGVPGVGPQGPPGSLGNIDLRTIGRGGRPTTTPTGVGGGDGGVEDGDIGGPYRDWLSKIGSPTAWDPEIWDHIPSDLLPGGIETPLPDMDPCLVNLSKIIASRNGEPARPTKVVWSDNITSLSVTLACKRQPLRINGHGFGNSPASNVGLMLPRKGKCTPTAFVPGTWSDTVIEITLPDDITSGPIGFVDLDYVDKYNKWTSEVNQAIEEMEKAGCGQTSPLQQMFSECPAQSPVNIFKGGDAFINDFSILGQTAAVVTQHQSVTISWDVVNATSVALFCLGPDNPTINGLSKLENLNPVGHVTFTALHNKPEKWLFRLVASGHCDADVKDIQVIATKAPGLRIESFEVTQGIQTESNSIRLVESKPTIVRVRLSHSLNSWGSNVVGRVTGRIKVVRADNTTVVLDPVNGSIGSPPLPNPGTSITVKQNPDRWQTDDTLNFYLAPALCVGALNFTVEARVDGFDARLSAGGFPAFAGHIEVIQRKGPSLKFEPRRRLKIKYVRIKWAGTIPTPNETRNLIERGMQYLPTPGVILEDANVGTLIFPESTWPSHPNNEAEAKKADEEKRASKVKLLELLDLTKLGSIVNDGSCLSLFTKQCQEELSTFWLAVVFFDVGGIAHIPGTTAVVSRSPLTVAHELGHCLGQYHLSSFCQGVQPFNKDEPEFDDWLHWPGFGYTMDVPFDVFSNRTAATASPVTFDLMTYCPDRWTTEERWVRLWDRVGP